jgi:hypothetical protein
MRALTYVTGIVLLSVGTTAFAGKVFDGQIKAGSYGEFINCAYPNTVKLDGRLDDLAWTVAPWQLFGAKDATVPADNDADASVKFSVCADENYLYFAAHIADDKVNSNENTKCDVWNDDSVEVYVDMGNEKANAYDINDAQITIGADTVDAKADVKTSAGILGGCVGITQGPTTETIAVGTKTNDGWDSEVAIPWKNAGWSVKLKDGLVIGFNVQYNDDDDKGGRDSKLIWSAQEVAKGEGSWNNPSLFAELRLTNMVLAVSPKGKLTSAWGALKTTR